MSTLELVEGILRDFGKSHTNSEQFEHDVAKVQKRIGDFMRGQEITLFPAGTKTSLSLTKYIG